MVEKYAKVIDEDVKICIVGLGNDEEYYKRLGFHLLDVEQAYNGVWYLSGYAPGKPEPTIQEQIQALEDSITKRNLRAALLGDEYAINKIKDIEQQIEELRKQL
jgi:predicted S18 family serine protease